MPLDAQSSAPSHRARSEGVASAWRPGPPATGPLPASPCDDARAGAPLELKPGDGHGPEFVDDVIRGLSQAPKAVPTRCLWDEAGAILHERLAEGTLAARTIREAGLVEAARGEIATLVGPGAALVEFGHGTRCRTHGLLAALDRPRHYLALDLAGGHLGGSRARLAEVWPQLDVAAVAADEVEAVSLPTAFAGRSALLAFVPAGLAGSFAPANLHAFLSEVHGLLGRGWLLMGVDGDRDRDGLVLACAGTDPDKAAFHVNLLHRIARLLGGLDGGAKGVAKGGPEDGLGGDLRPEDFAYAERLRCDPCRIESHLVAARAGTCRIGGRGFAFAAGESILTATDYRYAPGSVQETAVAAGWEPVRCWLDEGGSFSLHLLRA